MIQNSPGFNGVLYQLSYQSMARAAGNDPALGDLEFPFLPTDTRKVVVVEGV